MKKIYCCDASRSMYEDYYARQNGGEMSVFAGARTQRGHGLGSMLGGLFRRILPFLKSGAKFLAPKVMKAGMQITDDVVAGKSFKESVKERVPGAIKEAMSGVNLQSGSGFRKRRITRKRRSGAKRRRVANKRLTLGKKKRRVTRRKTRVSKKKSSRLINALNL